ncbi:MAG: response regulator [Proteobacteria bacterium]|nr:response regulator [Pseudomonadota bacterium]
MLNNILWTLVVIAGISVTISFIAEIRTQRYALALIYALVYAGIVFACAKQSVNYHIRAFIPLAMIYGLAISEFYFFGATPLSFVFLYTLIIFSGLLYGFKASMASLLLVIASISARFWIEQYQHALESGEPLLSGNVLGDWLSPMMAFLCCASMALVAITMMLRQLSSSLADKSQLVEELTREIENSEKTQKALDASEGQYSALFKRSNDAVFLIDTLTGKHLQVNQAAELLTGLPAYELQKLCIDDVSPEHSNAILNSARGTENRAELEQVTYRKADGSERVAEVHTTPVSEGLAFVIARDVTESKKLEEQFIQSQKMEAVGQLAGGVAHDFNNSLQAMLIFAETAVEKSTDADVQSDLKRLLEAGERAQRLVSQLLAFSRHQVLQMEDINLNSTIDESLNLIRRIIGEHIKLDFESFSKPLMIRADRVQVEQILMNLCINARDAMGDIGTLLIALDSITVDANHRQENRWAISGDFVRLRVTDTGSGMDEVIQQKIFEPFFTTKELGKGTGLGLSTVFGIVRQHKGFIQVDSEVGKGTSIEIYLPQIEGTGQTVQTSVSTVLKTGTETVLLADDDDLVREAIEAMLELSGFRVLTAANGHDAIQVFEEHAADIDLVILDMVMPNMSGKTVSKHIADIKPGVPILFASGYSRDAIHTDFVLDEGINFIQKPYGRVALLDKVRDMLDREAA